MSGRQRVIAWRRGVVETTRGVDEFYEGDLYRSWVPATEVEVQLEDKSWVPLLNRTLVHDDEGMWLESSKETPE